MAADPVAKAPEHERFASPSGRFRLEIRLRPGAGPHAASSTASLFDVSSSTSTPLWSRELAHRPRPRFAVVGDRGEVLLVDEWLNLRSELTLMLIDRANRVLAVHDLEAVRSTLGVPLRALPAHARHGTWLQAPPALSADGKSVELSAAHRVLVVQLQDGSLSRR